MNKRKVIALLKGIRYRKIRADLSFLRGGETVYKNNWGNWVWRDPTVPEDRNWGGLKPPNDKCIPVLYKGIWHWKHFL